MNEGFLDSEIGIMKKIDHLNLVKLHEVIDDPRSNKINLIMDYMDLGYIGCQKYKKFHKIKEKTLPMHLVRHSIRECLKGLDYCKKYILVNLPTSAQCGRGHPL